MTSEPASGEEPTSSSAEASPPAEPSPSKLEKAPRKGQDPVGAETKPATPLPGAGTPEGEQLADAYRAFDIGDYARVRTQCRALREARQDDVARAARDLDARTRVDLVQVLVLCACLAFFLWIAYVYVIR